ncbi:MAG: outer membrane lipoprotein LolB [Wenzhouxiangella sp.]|nr:MAG: outer membrane lipoprotein LolB [Wenzhouxiangella sp.]
MNARMNAHVSQPRRAGIVMLRGLMLALMALALASGCAVREQREAGAWLDEREALFATYPDWSVSGRMALSDGSRGGSLAFDWRADGSEHDVHLRTVAGGRQWRLSFGPNGAMLEGSGIERMWALDPDPLVEAAVGWPVPVREMAWWIRGLPPPGSQAVVSFAADGALSRVESDPWVMVYQRFDQGREALMPSRFQAESGDYRVRVVLRDWQLGPSRSHPVSKSL